MSDAVYEFEMRATGYDRTGYYYPNWDHAEHVEVRAATKQQAINKAAEMLGQHPRHGSWTFKVDKIREIPPCKCGDKDEA